MCVLCVVWWCALHHSVGWYVWWCVCGVLYGCVCYMMVYVYICVCICVCIQASSVSGVVCGGVRHVRCVLTVLGRTWWCVGL